MTKIAIPPASWFYHFLIVPTFLPNCYITLEELGTSLELSLTILGYGNDSNGFDHALTPQIMSSINNPAWADIVEVSDSQRTAVHQQLKQIEPTSLTDIDLAIRDGIGIRCWYHDPQTEHTFQMRTPTKQHTPKHHTLMLTLIDLACINFDDPIAQTYLSALRDYFD